MLVLQRGLLCLFNSRNPALRNGTEPHTRDKLIQQQWHETVLFFILLLLSPHEAASLNSYFIYYWLPWTIIYKGGLQRKRQGKVDSDLRNAPHVKATAVNQKHKLAYVLQPQRIQLGKLNLKKLAWSVGWAGRWWETHTTSASPSLHVMFTKGHVQDEFKCLQRKHLWSKMTFLHTIHPSTLLPLLATCTHTVGLHWWRRYNPVTRKPAFAKHIYASSNRSWEGPGIIFYINPAKLLS